MFAENMPEMQLSEKVCAIPEALSVYLNNIVYSMQRNGEKVLVLSLGEAFFDIPKYSFDDLDFTKGYHYSESRGLYELRFRLADHYENRYGITIDADSEIIISAGSKVLIYMALQAVLNSGDEVLVPEPAWLSYSEEIKLAGGIPVFIPYSLDISSVSECFSPKTKVLIINNPNNPSGRVFSEAELRELYSMCRKRGVYILADEAYSDFLPAGSFSSMLHIVPDKDGIIVVNSLSKNMGISGWRIGYAVSRPEVIYNILKLNQHLITCAPTVLLMYVAEHFDDIMSTTVPQAQAVAEKRKEFEQFICEIGLSVMPGSATFYLFVDIGKYSRTSFDLAMYLLTKYHISVVPGSAYGRSTERYIRISVGTEPLEKLKQALSIIKQVIDCDEYNAEYIDKTLRTLNIKKF